MPLLGFTKLLDKLLNHSKIQTIRFPRKYPFKIGDRLFIYWQLRTKNCMKLGEGIVTNVERVRLLMLTNEDIRKDGFAQKDGSVDRQAFFDLFFMMHPYATLDDMVDIITWKWKT